MGFYQLKVQQEIPSTIQDVWDFIKTPANLKEITPSYMGFDITSEPVNEMYEGQMISYKVSPLFGIKMTWVTEITHVKEQKYFVDEQRLGPYVMWHHEHLLEELPNGNVLMKDIVSYIPPFGILGNIANSLLIKRQLKEIFDYRKTAVIKRFGTL